MVRYTRFAYTKESDAKKKAKSMKGIYGYMPTIFRETSPRGRTKFVVIKSKGMERMR